MVQRVCFIVADQGFQGRTTPVVDVAIENESATTGNWLGTNRRDCERVLRARSSGDQSLHLYELIYQPNADTVNALLVTTAVTTTHNPSQPGSQASRSWSLVERSAKSKSNGQMDATVFTWLGRGSPFDWLADSLRSALRVGQRPTSKSCRRAAGATASQPPATSHPSQPPASQPVLAKVTFD
jgi:hypothetical protein